MQSNKHMNKFTIILLLLLNLSGLAEACTISENKYISMQNINGIFASEEDFFKKEYEISNINTLQIDSAIIMNKFSENIAVIPVSVNIPENYRGWKLHLIVSSNVVYSSNNNLKSMPLFQKVAKFTLNENITNITTKLRALADKFTVYALLINKDIPTKKVLMKPFHASGYSCGVYVFVQSQEEIDTIYKNQEKRIKNEAGENI